MTPRRLAPSCLYVVLLGFAGCSCGGSGTIRNAPSDPLDAPTESPSAGDDHTDDDGPTWPPEVVAPPTTPPTTVPTDPPAVDNTDGLPAQPGKVRTLSLGASWQWQLSGTIADSLEVEAYDIDLFEAPQGIIDRLHEKGKAVICYFSAGSREDWRPDADEFATDDYGETLDGWRGEHWLDVRSDNVRRIMLARLDMAVERGCDAVEPDNVDGFSNESGFPLERTDQVAYNRFLARAAHSRGLGVGLKNSPELVTALEPDFDWALTEECLEYRECARFRPFVDAGKAVLHTEYVDREGEAPAKLAEVCASPQREGFSTLVKTWDLGSEFYSCDP